MAKHTVSKALDLDGNIEENCYEYRGYTFYRNTNVSPGYFGRYSTVNGRYNFSYQADVKAHIDKIVDNA